MSEFLTCVCVAFSRKTGFKWNSPLEIIAGRKERFDWDNIDKMFIFLPTYYIVLWFNGFLEIVLSKVHSTKASTDKHIISSYPQVFFFSLNQSTFLKGIYQQTDSFVLSGYSYFFVKTVAHCAFSSNLFHGHIVQKHIDQMSLPENKKCSPGKVFGIKPPSNLSSFEQERP